MLTRSATTRLPTAFGELRLLAYTENGEASPHLALVKGQPERAESPLVRIHSECLTGEVFASQRCDCGFQLEAAMREIEREGVGVIIYLRQEGRGIGLLNKIRAYSMQDGGLDTVDANLHLGFEADARDYSAAIEILTDLGVRAVRLLTNNPDKIAALERSPIRLTARVPLVAPPTVHSRDYLETKRRRMGHLLADVKG
ncbi:MAG TPA: GTP cyclohydrolase II [Thermoanaerobaculia bacterium]|jgi:3,4-dihydroxy 2-butanone 4-phosphate synthase/GTP cyclohydrolase II